MAVQTRRMTVEEFDQFIQQPENAERLFEYVGGEIIEVVSSNYSSEVAARILIEIGIFVKNKNMGRVTGADGGYMVSGERYIPDVAFISKEKQPEPSHEAYNPTPPDLAVEVLSPSNDPADIRIKLFNYLHAGTVVWLVDPDKKEVEVYASGQAKKLGLDSILDGGDVLPSFMLPVKEIFPD
jgi:Uma2 family endonuclease